MDKTLDDISLIPLSAQMREQFITDLQKAFKDGVEAEFGPSDHEEDVIPRQDIEASLNAEGAMAFMAMEGDNIIGGCVVNIRTDTQRNSLDLLYVRTDCHSRGIGMRIWREIEKKFPDTKVWETCTPYFEKRNIHFYVNKCGFHITQFYCKAHPDPHSPEDYTDHPGHIDQMFHFEKVMHPKDLNLNKDKDKIKLNNRNSERHDGLKS